jgi:hypothetical protein
MNLLFVDQFLNILNNQLYKLQSVVYFSANMATRYADKVYKLI